MENFMPRPIEPTDNFYESTRLRKDQVEILREYFTNQIIKGIFMSDMTHEDKTCIVAVAPTMDANPNNIEILDQSDGDLIAVSYSKLKGIETVMDLEIINRLDTSRSIFGILPSTLKFMRQTERKPLFKNTTSFPITYKGRKFDIEKEEFYVIEPMDKDNDEIYRKRNLNTHYFLIPVKKTSKVVQEIIK